MPPPTLSPRAQALADQQAIDKRRRELLDEKQTFDARKEEQVLKNLRSQSYRDIDQMQFAPQNPIQYNNTVPAMELSQQPLVQNYGEGVPEVTRLEPDQERAYRAWLDSIGVTKSNGYNMDDNYTGLDYDYRGFFKEKGPLRIDQLNQGHFTDTYKLPNHETFSVESRYAVGPNRARAGRWNGDTYIPPQQQAQPPQRPRWSQAPIVKYGQPVSRTQ